MRIRSIKPEFWRSDDIAALPISARLLFIGLWSYVDDNGVGLDKLPSIAADLFADDLAVDPAETLGRVAADTTRLSDAGLIFRYKAGGKPLLYVTKWESHQIVKNPSKGHLYELPSGEMLTNAHTLRRPSVDPAETLGTGAGEQGSRGAEEQGKKLSNDQRESSDCNAREFSSEELEAVKEMLGETIRDTLDDLETAVAVELITEAATAPVENLPAYLRASIDASPDRITGLVREGIRQVSRTRS